MHRTKRRRLEGEHVRPTAIDRYLGGRVRQRRMMFGMSQMALAEKLGVTFQQLQKNEKGTNRIDASRLVDPSQVSRCRFSSISTTCRLTLRWWWASRRASTSMRWAWRLARWLDRDLKRIGGQGERLGAALRVLGHERRRPRQLEIAHAALEGKSLLTVSPRGSGKSLCFRLAAILSPRMAGAPRTPAANTAEWLRDDLRANSQGWRNRLP